MQHQVGAGTAGGATQTHLHPTHLNRDAGIGQKVNITCSLPFSPEIGSKEWICALLDMCFADQEGNSVDTYPHFDSTRHTEKMIHWAHQHHERGTLSETSKGKLGKKWFRMILKGQTGIEPVT